MTRPRQRGGPHRQTERAGHRAFLSPRPAGDCQQTLPHRVGAARRWESFNGYAVKIPSTTRNVQYVGVVQEEMMMSTNYFMTKRL